MSQVSWMVDWESLFGGFNRKYRRCVVRTELTSQFWTGVGTDWDTYGACLMMSLPSPFSNYQAFGTPIDLIFPTDCPITGTNRHCYIQSSLSNQCGVDVNMPSGVNQLDITFADDGVANKMITSPLSPSLQTTQTTGTIGYITTAITLSASNASIEVGQYITGPGVPEGTTVAAISGANLTASQNVNIPSGTQTLSFYNKEIAYEILIQFEVSEPIE